MKNIQLLQGDCMKLMHDLPDASVDLILCDLPYGTTGVACVNTGRRFIGMEKDAGCFATASARITEAILA